MYRRCVYEKGTATTRAATRAGLFTRDRSIDARAW